MEEEILPSPPSPSDALDANGNEVPMSAIMPPGVDGRTQVIQELLETERKYVADLEVMQVCLLPISPEDRVANVTRI
jgi:hypothetical protein